MESNIRNNKIRAIIFDLGNVLIKVNFEKMLINQVKEKIGSTSQEIMEAAYKDELFKDFCSGKIDTQAFYRKLIDRLNLSINYSKFQEKWCDIFEPMDGMDNLINQLKNDFKIGLLSDTDPLHWRHVLSKFQFLQSIENPTLSYETGCMKPHPSIYRIATKNVNYPADSCLFIDDRAVNVEGAIKAGMKAIQFKGVNSLKAQLVDMGLF